MRAELRALGRVQAALEQRAQDRRVDLAPIEGGGLQRRLDLFPRQRQGVIAVEEAAVEPGDGFETDAAACGHGAK